MNNWKNVCVCEVCGSKFFSRVKTAKSCSKSCGDKRYKLLHLAEIKEYRLKNKKRIKEQRAKHYRDNIEKERKNCQKWYLAHRESEIEKNKEYRKQNRELFDWYHNKDRFGGIREIILKRDNHKCRVCDSQKRISVHHKDGKGYHQRDKFGIESNNDTKNLITLCSSCHSRLHRFQEREKTIILQDEDIVRTIRRLIEVGVNNPR